MVHLSRLDPSEYFLWTARAKRHSGQRRVARMVAREKRPFSRKNWKTRFSHFAKNPTKSHPRCTSGEHEFKLPNSPAREKNGSDRTPMVRMVHPDHRRPITFIFLARGSVCDEREGRSACTSVGGLCQIFRNPRKPGFSSSVSFREKSQLAHPHLQQSAQL